MRRALLILGLALAALAATATAASASFPIRISPGPRNITLTGLRFTVEGPLGLNVICDITLVGAIAGSVARAGGSLGGIDDVNVSNCSHPTRPLDNNVWPMVASSTLDTGAGMHGVLIALQNVGFSIDLGALGTCLASGQIHALIGLTLGGATTGVRTLASTLPSDCLFITGRVVANQGFTLAPTLTIT